MRKLSKKELQGMKKQELLDYCKKNDIKVYSNKNKIYIINVILQSINKPRKKIREGALERLERESKEEKLKKKFEKHGIKNKKLLENYDEYLNDILDLLQHENATPQEIADVLDELNIRDVHNILKVHFGMPYNEYIKRSRFHRKHGFSPSKKRWLEGYRTENNTKKKMEFKKKSKKMNIDQKFYNSLKNNYYKLIFSDGYVPIRHLMDAVYKDLGLDPEKTYDEEFMKMFMKNYGEKYKTLDEKKGLPALGRSPKKQSPRYNKWYIKFYN